MAAISQNVQLAKSLPPRLLRFFARYPPASIQASTEAPKTAYQIESPNPFRSTKHPVTGKWHDPVYSLRRQAELVKLARDHGVEELLPFTHKGTEERIRNRVEHGLRVKGTGVGQQVKGHKHERQMIAKYARISFPIDGGPVRLLTLPFTGWRRGERPFSECRASSGSGRRFVYQLASRYHRRIILISWILGWETQLDQIPQIVYTGRMSFFCFIVQRVLPNVQLSHGNISTLAHTFIPKEYNFLLSRMTLELCSRTGNR